MTPVSARVHALALALALAACVGSTEAPPSAQPTSERPGTQRDPDRADGTDEADEADARDTVDTRDTVDSGPIRLPLRRLASGHIVVAVTVDDGSPVEFVLDTGASVSVVTPSTRDRAGFGPEDGVIAQAAGAGGSIPEVRVLELPHLGVAGRDYSDLTVAVMDLSHLDEDDEHTLGGILGKNFLARHVVSLDFVDGELLLFPADAVESGQVHVDGLLGVAYTEFPAGLIRLDVAVDGGATMPAVLDLGAGRTIMNWHAAGELGLSPDAGELQRVDSMRGADNNPLDARLRTFERLTLGDLEFQSPPIVIADLPVFEQLGVAGVPAMVVGVDLFAHRELVLDFGARRLYVSELRPPGPSAS